jgi:hypothetical protein
MYARSANYGIGFYGFSLFAVMNGLFALSDFRKKRVQQGFYKGQAKFGRGQK